MVKTTPGPRTSFDQLAEEFELSTKEKIRIQAFILAVARNSDEGVIDGLLAQTLEVFGPSILDAILKRYQELIASEA